MKEFDFYQIIGVVAPGMVLFLGTVLLFFPEQQNMIQAAANTSLGSLGFSVIIAYVVGQLLQIIGNVVEKIWWRMWGGIPTDWLRSNKHELLIESQRNLIAEKVRSMAKVQEFSFNSINKKQWYSLTRQAYTTIYMADKIKRIDIFNANYGLCRGIATAFLILLLLSIITWRAWQVDAVLVLLISLSLCRMHRFAVNYGRELFIQYLQLKES